MKIIRPFLFILLPLILLALGFQLGVNYHAQSMDQKQAQLEEMFGGSGSGTTAEGDPEKEVNLSLFWSVWRLLQKNYINPGSLKVNEMVYGAVGGMVDAVGDPYTLFMTPVDTKSFDDAMSGTLEGIGAQLDEQDGKIVVVAPIKGSPAEKAGLLSRDVIVKVNDQMTEGMALDQVVSLIRGPKGTTVTLGIVRQGASALLTLMVTRENIHIPSVESKTVQSKVGAVGVVALNQFGDEALSEVQAAIAALPKNMKAFVLDLRFNGGGYLDGAVDLVSLFQRTGTVVTVVRRDGPSEVHSVSGKVLLPDIPMVVLINGGSASASEITAGALKDLNRATIIGTQSFGKGTVQEIIDLPGGSALRVTTAKWQTPSGHDLGKTGITPDVVVDRTAEEYKAGKDPQLDAAVKFFEEKK